MAQAAARGCAATVAVVALTLLGCASVAPKAHAKGSGGAAKVGEVECPCFCSRRTGDPMGPYWSDTFGTLNEDFHGIAAAAPCVNPADVADLGEKLPFCAQYLDYRFGARFMNSTTVAISRADVTTDEGQWAYRRHLDNHAAACADDLPELAEFQSGTDCHTTIEKGSCHIAFPKCHAETDELLPICKSFCVNEVRGCRTEGSMFGPTNVIEEGCTGYPWADFDGPHPECTGAATGGRVWAAIWASAVAVLGAVAVLLATDIRR